jgi:hypothetical protein
MKKGTSKIQVRRNSQCIDRQFVLKAIPPNPTKSHLKIKTVPPVSINRLIINKCQPMPVKAGGGYTYTLELKHAVR